MKAIIVQKIDNKFEESSIDLGGVDVSKALSLCKERVLKSTGIYKVDIKNSKGVLIYRIDSRGNIGKYFSNEISIKVKDLLSNFLEVGNFYAYKRSYHIEIYDRGDGEVGIYFSLDERDHKVTSEEALVFLSDALDILNKSTNNIPIFNIDIRPNSLGNSMNIWLEKCPESEGEYTVYI